MEGTRHVQSGSVRRELQIHDRPVGRGKVCAGSVDRSDSVGGLIIDQK